MQEHRYQHWSVKVNVLLCLEHFCKNSIYDFRAYIPDNKRDELTSFLKSLHAGNTVCILSFPFCFRDETNFVEDADNPLILTLETGPFGVH